MVATRSTPSCSESENWFSTKPRTSPDARYSADSASSANLWIAVKRPASTCCSGSLTAGSNHFSVATNRLLFDA